MPDYPKTAPTRSVPPFAPPPRKADHGHQDTDVSTDAHSGNPTSIGEGNLREQVAELLVAINAVDAGVLTDHTLLTNIGTNTHAQIDTHIADSTIHFTEGAIDHTNILNIGTNTHAQIDTHIADSTVHFTEGAIDHTSILNIGTNTHAQIDTHIADATLHFTEGSIDHGSIAGLADDDHTQYALLAGRDPGQTLYFGDATGVFGSLYNNSVDLDGFLTTAIGVEVHTNNIVRFNVSDTLVDFQHPARMRDGKGFYFGDALDTRVEWNVSQTDQNLVWGLNDVQKAIIFCDAADMGFNFQHGSQTDPTIFVHDNTQSTTAWTSLSHGLLTTGDGPLEIQPQSSEFRIAAPSGAGDIFFSFVSEADGVGEFGFYEGASLRAQISYSSADEALLLRTLESSSGITTLQSVSGEVRIKSNTAWIPEIALYEGSTQRASFRHNGSLNHTYIDNTEGNIDITATGQIQLTSGSSAIVANDRIFANDSVTLINLRKVIFGDPVVAELGLDQTNQTNDAVVWGLDNANPVLVFCELEDRLFDFAHSATNPTTFWHDTTQSTTAWTSLSHGLVDTGGDDLSLSAGGNEGLYIRGSDGRSVHTNNATFQASFDADTDAFFRMGTGGLTRLGYSSAETFDSLIWTFGAAEALVIKSWLRRNDDHQVADQSVPVIFIFDDTNPGVDATQWTSLKHGEIATGAGPLTLNPATYTRTGTGTPTFATTSEDLFVSSLFETGGNSKFGGYAWFTDNLELRFGTGGPDFHIEYSTTQTEDSAIFTVGADSNGLILCEEADAAYDFQHGLQTNPTLWVQSANQSLTEWTSLAHGVIATGAGDLTFDPITGVVEIDHGTLPTVRFTESGTARATIAYNATDNILKLEAEESGASLLFQPGTLNFDDIALRLENQAADHYLLDVYGDVGVGATEKRGGAVVYRHRRWWQLNTNLDLTTLTASGQSFTATTKGTISTSPQPWGATVTMQTAATTNEDAGWVSSAQIVQRQHDPVIVQCRMATRLTAESTQDVRIWIGLTSSEANLEGSKDPGATTDVAAFRFDTSGTADTNWMAYTADNTSSTATSTGVSIASGTVYHLEMRLFDDRVEFYIDGDLKVTQTTNLPQNSADLLGVFQIRALADAAKQIYFNTFYLESE